MKQPLTERIVDVRVRDIPLVSARCRRCVKPFSYYRRGRQRYFCEPCRELERKDANDFFNTQARQKRAAARMNAFLAHEEAQ